MRKQMKKTIAVLLSVLLCCSALTALPVSAFAATTAEQTVGATSGITGDCTWTFDEATGTLIISGNGAMANYDFDNYAPWKNSYVKQVVIKKGVTSIGKFAFYGCTSLTSVTIPDSVTSIGKFAFYGCTGLTSVTIPDSVTSIGNCAFEYCTGLTSVTIPDSVTSIGSYAFRFCEKLTDITIPDSVTSIGEWVFYNTAWYNNQPDGLVYAGKVAYQYKGTCPSNVKIKAGTLGIAGSAFRDCEGLTSVTIPDSVTSIGEFAFEDCTGLTNVTIPDSVTFIGYGAFEGCKELTSITIPDGVTNIDQWAFWGCDGLTSVIIPDSVTSIGYEAFRDCKGLTRVTIPDSVTSIDDGAFEWCTRLTSITIPGSVTSIGERAFEHTAWYFNQPDGLVYAGKVAYEYKGNCPSNVEIKADTLGIAGSAFSDCVSLTSITIPDSVTSIGERAFSGCTGLTSVTIPDSVTIIGNRAFKGCTGLTSVTIPDSVTSIGESAFEGCTGLTSVTIPDSVKSIGDHAFGYHYESVDDFSGDWKQLDSFTIFGYKNSAASVYALRNGFNFVAIQNSISECSITLSQTSYIYDGKVKTPGVTVKEGSKTLTKDTDYTVSYKNNTNVGKATLTVIGKGDYIGTATESFTIDPKSISSATVTLSQTSYTYDGKAKTPGVTVKDSSKTLTKDSDYTVTYKNNINVGTATVTVTGKGNYTNNVSKTFTITSDKKTFVWGQNNWNFNNSPSYFSTKPYGTFKYRDLINSTYSNKLKNNLSNTEYQRVFGTYGYLNYTWGGSCYGMAVLNVLAKSDIIPYTTYKSGASNLHSLYKPVDDNKVNSLITYYHMLQKKDVIQQLNYKYNNKSNEQIIKELISLLDNNPAVLVCFFTNTWGHAIVATGYEYGSWTYNGITYQGCIKICDPNSSTAYDKDYNIYFNSKSYNWAIPEYYWDGGSSTKGASFGFISADTSVLNSGGYHNASSFGDATTFDNTDESFVARIDAYSISDNRHVSKVRYESGQYTTSYSAPGDIEEDNSYVFAGESGAVAGYNLYDSQSAYQVTQDEHVEMQLSLNYGNCYLMGGSMAGESVLFDKDGYVQVKGESANYNISMTFNDYYPTDWFTIEVSGSNADTVFLKKADSGYILSADTLESVKIDCSNRSSIATSKFTTGYDSVFIYEIDNNTIGLRVDTDGNGTYETELPTDTFQIGDVNDDGKVNGADAGLLNRYTSGWEGYAEKIKNMDAADINRDGKVNGADSGLLNRYTSGWDTVKKYFTAA